MRDPGRSRMRRLVPRGLVLALAAAAACLAPAPSARAADLDDAGKLFNSGQYEKCIEACAEAGGRNRLDEGWWLLKIRAELATGKYAESMQSYEAALVRHDRSIPLLLLGHDVLRA